MIFWTDLTLYFSGRGASSIALNLFPKNPQNFESTRVAVSLLRSQAKPCEKIELRDIYRHGFSWPSKRRTCNFFLFYCSWGCLWHAKSTLLPRQLFVNNKIMCVHFKHINKYIFDICYPIT